jgi:hypothetical protein
MNKAASLYQGLSLRLITSSPVFDIWIEDTLQNRKNLRTSFIKLSYGDFPSLETMEFLPGWTSFYVDDAIELHILTKMKGLEDQGITQSMSRKGNCYDNAIIENFFGTIKSEMCYLKKYISIDELKNDIKEYIRYYNNDRIKLNLKGTGPIKYRAHHCN